MSKTITLTPSEAPKENACSFQAASNDAQEKIVVVGAGPVGIRFASELLKRKGSAFITVFGNEPYQPYNRVQLSSLLAGDIGFDDIITPLPDNTRYPNFSHIISAIRTIDYETKTLIDSRGNIFPYDKCVIATGSRPHKPNIPGVDTPGVYTFRNLKDAEALYARVSRARDIVVIGGGLLGLEAAKAMLRFNTKVTLVQQGPRLMNRQLDDGAAEKLQRIVAQLGIRVITDSGVRSITGDGRVAAVVTRDKEEIACDTVLLCAGIRANIEIARNARIAVANGILVDDQLQTSAPNVYAIGECCEHRGSTYGLVNPGYEQAAILAENLAGGNAQYVGSLEISRLKVLGTNICSMGEVSELGKRPRLHEFRFQQKKRGIYRKIVTVKGRLIGAVGFGEWSEARRVQEAFQNQRSIRLWHIVSFLINGKLFFGHDTNVNLWPRSAIVCQCNNISQGACVDAIDEGHNTLIKLQTCTAAGTVCGSCKPLLFELMGYAEPAQKEKAWLSLLLASAIAIMIAIAIIAIPAIGVSESVQDAGKFNFESFWNDKFWKQVSGFSILGMSALGLLMSLRKRVKKKALGDFAYWRMLHIFLGVLCISTLVAHTGLHMGANLNRALMINFLGIVMAGSIAGVVFSLSDRLGAHKGKQLRSFWTWLHIFLTWPLPVLLGFHILSVYYF